MQYFLEFDPLDNPMHLSKVGNWIITFLSPKEELTHIQLAIAHVLPRQICDYLQPRRLIMRSGPAAHHWEIESIECFDSSLKQDIMLQPENAQAQQVIHTILQDFERYGVSVNFKSSPPK
ncbi:hypothetical protein [Acinetobacter sp.]|uniref:hypothetical protein n=1 Tax=Acinetobacter sp. TaxID=472 RepID=UPI0035B4409B